MGDSLSLGMGSDIQFNFEGSGGPDWGKKYVSYNNATLLHYNI